METIISSVITGAVAIAVCLISNAIQANKTNAVIEYKIENLTSKVEKHNNLIERVYKLEAEVETLEKLETRDDCK